MQADGAQLVFSRLEKGAGAVVRQEDRRAIRAEQGPEVQSRINFGCFREAARHMIPRGRGTILFTGATASIRGGSGYSAFSGAKAALRMLAQSMARELGPKGIHVAHTVIDGGIDTEFIKGRHPAFDEAKAADLILSPDAIAANYVMLHKQPKSAWTHELDLRPWGEKW